MTIADFHCEGTIPVFHIVLNKFKRVRVAVVPRCFKNSACTLSDPGDFLNFSWLIALFNSFTVNGSSKIGRVCVEFLSFHLELRLIVSFRIVLDNLLV